MGATYTIPHLLIFEGIGATYPIAALADNAPMRYVAPKMKPSRPEMSLDALRHTLDPRPGPSR